MGTEPLKYRSVNDIIKKCLGRGFKDTGEKRDYIPYAILKEVHEINERLKISVGEIPEEKAMRE